MSRVILENRFVFVDSTVRCQSLNHAAWISYWTFGFFLLSNVILITMSITESIIWSPRHLVPMQDWDIWSEFTNYVRMIATRTNARTNEENIYREPNTFPLIVIIIILIAFHVQCSIVYRLATRMCTCICLSPSSCVCAPSVDLLLLFTIIRASTCNIYSTYKTWADRKYKYVD